jgi:DNA-binding transcriptional regulator GbsR (MarR family)
MANSSIEKAKNAFVDRMGQLASELGLNAAVGSIYALLYMSSEPVCLDEITEACGMSKGNASMNLRELERWGAVRRVPVRGDRKSYYEANLDIVGIVRSRLKEGLERRMQEADRALGVIEKAVEDAGSKKGKDGSVRVMKERLAKVRETEAAVRTLLDTFL